VSCGAALYRALDAVERLKHEGIDVGLLNKPTLNVVDEAMLARVRLSKGGNSGSDITIR
jgi:transketolase C-terminal domain/subunit